MPRQMTFRIGKTDYSAVPVKIDRRKLYGWSELMADDDNGDPCNLLTADETGKNIIPLGGTGIGILSESGRWVERSELRTVDADGKPAKLYESSFSGVNVLSEKITPRQVLDYSITDFYLLSDEPPEMAGAVGDDIYLFEYTYNDSYDPSPAFVMVAGGVPYMLAAVKNIYEWLCFGDCGMIEDEHDDRIIDEGGEDIDFSMF